MSKKYFIYLFHLFVYYLFVRTTTSPHTPTHQHTQTSTQTNLIGTRTWIGTLDKTDDQIIASPRCEVNMQTFIIDVEKGLPRLHLHLETGQNWRERGRKLEIWCYIYILLHCCGSRTKEDNWGIDSFSPYSLTSNSVVKVLCGVAWNLLTNCHTPGLHTHMHTTRICTTPHTPQK